MAVKIGTDNIVKMFRPRGYKFTLDELNETVDGFIEPLKIGPLWVMYDEEAKEKGQILNNLASTFFDVPIYGTVLVVPPHQLPGEWELMEPEDYRYTADDIDSGFLLSLQKVLNHMTADELLSSRIAERTEEYLFAPPKAEELDANTIEFYNQSVDFIKKNPGLFKKNIIYQEPGIIIKIDNSDKETLVNQMINYFVSVEEYEKCTIMKNVYEA
jgi:hypothetical protein